MSGCADDLAERNEKKSGMRGERVSLESHTPNVRSKAGNLHFSAVSSWVERGKLNVLARKESQINVEEILFFCRHVNTTNAHENPVDCYLARWFRYARHSLRFKLIKILGSSCI